MHFTFDKRTNVLYNDICDFVAFCEKFAKTEYQCQHIERASCTTTRRQANVIAAHVLLPSDHGQERKKCDPVS